MASASEAVLEKERIRKRILALRAQMDDGEWAEKSGRIAARLLRHPLYRGAEHILCYVSYRKEADTERILTESLSAGKAVYCPRVRGREMDFYRIDSVKELSAGFHGIYEPQERAERLFAPDSDCCEISGRVLAILPGAAFDRERRRIGYGGGYYDRYLKRLKNAASIALAFSFQIVESVPQEAHDIRPQAVLTECGEL